MGVTVIKKKIEASPTGGATGALPRTSSLLSATSSLPRSESLRTSTSSRRASSRVTSDGSLRYSTSSTALGPPAAAAGLADDCPDNRGIPTDHVNYFEAADRDPGKPVNLPTNFLMFRHVVDHVSRREVQPTRYVKKKRRALYVKTTFTEGAKGYEHVPPKETTRPVEFAFRSPKDNHNSQLAEGDFLALDTQNATVSKVSMKMKEQLYEQCHEIGAFQSLVEFQCVACGEVKQVHEFSKEGWQTRLDAAQPHRSSGMCRECSHSPRRDRGRPRSSESVEGVQSPAASGGLVRVRSQIQDQSWMKLHTEDDY